MMMAMAAMAMTAQAAAPELTPAGACNGKVSKGAVVSSRTRSNAPARAEVNFTIDDLIGNAMYNEDRAINGEGAGWNYGWSFCQIVKGEAENEVLIHNFWNPTGGDVINCTLKGTFDPATGKLTVPTGVSVGKVKIGSVETEEYLFMQDWRTNKCSKDPMVFTYDPDAHMLSWAGGSPGSYTTNLIVTTNPDCDGQIIYEGEDFITAVELAYYNTVASTTIPDQNGNTTTSTYPIYASYSKDLLRINNLVGVGNAYTVEFVVDVEEGSLSAKRQLYAADYGSEDNYDDVYWEGDGDNKCITGTYVVVGDNSRVDLGVIRLVGDRFGQLGTSTGTVFDVPFNLDIPGTDGIVSVEADEQNAAPVYYNLQGMRLDNPVKGQIVIRRCGDKTMKMIVR